MLLFAPQVVDNLKVKRLDLSLRNRKKIKGMVLGLELTVSL